MCQKISSILDKALILIFQFKNGTGKDYNTEG